jgi:hypothetical protein
MQLRSLLWVGLLCACGEVASSPDAAAPATMRVVTISVTGNGTGTVTSNPAGIDCGTDCSEPFAEGSSITLTATAAAGSTFMGWGSGSCTGTGDCVITVGEDIAIQPTFALANSIVVTVNGNGMGEVESEPSGIACPGDCSEQYGPGQNVTLTATPAAESVFAGWTGGGCAGTAPCMLVTDSATATTATFNLKKYALTITKGSNGAGTVTSAPAGISCGATCAFNFDSGTNVTLTPSPTVGSTFASWAGACTGSGACNVAMNAAKAVTANFTLTTHTLTVAKNGAGTGTVTSSNVAGISCGATCAATYNYGQSVTLTPSVTAGNSFAGWSGACTGTGACSVSMTAARSVTAKFDKVLTCSSVATANTCTQGAIVQIDNGAGMTAAQCDATCTTKMPQANMTSGCWIIPADGHCYCRSGTLNLGGTFAGGTCN